MLHILNGTATEATLRQSSLKGEFFSFRDALINGPAPAGVTGEEWRRIRAKHLSESYGVGFESCKQDLLTQEQTLASFNEHDELVLWFEQDLFCQLNLLYLLDWFAKVVPGKTKLSLICVGEFPGRQEFRGLGELSADELASLFPQRQEINSGHLELGADAWNAYRSSNPTDLASLLKRDTSIFPFLQTALSAHVRRYPSTANGLGRIENAALSLINDGLQKFVDLFPVVSANESVYGLGDSQVWLELRRLTQSSTPLLKVKNGNGHAARLTPAVVHQAEFELTESGRAVLNGDADYIELNDMDVWLGGVHLRGDHIWRWNEKEKALVLEV